MIAHHPSDPTLASYASGALPEALALVVATHLCECGACRATLAALEATAGALLDDLPPVALSDDALDRLLLRLDDPSPPGPPITNPELPAPLNRVRLGRWWPLGSGIRFRALRTGGSAWGVLLLVQPGRSLPRHGHAGTELTCVLTGAFADGNGEYAAGDLCEPTTDHDNPPTVIGSQPCLCVIASEGMRLRGLLGWLQRMIGQ